MPGLSNLILDNFSLTVSPYVGISPSTGYVSQSFSEHTICLNYTKNIAIFKFSHSLHRKAEKLVERVWNLYIKNNDNAKSVSELTNN